MRRVAGEGSPGRRGGPAGDLHVNVRVRPHPFYRREGDVLGIDLPLSVGEAALGAEVDVPVLDAVVRMKIPPGTQSGSVFRLRGKGVPRLGGGRGDAHVKVTVEIPVDPGPEARRLLAELELAVDADATPRRRELREAIARSRARGGASGRGAGGEGDADPGAAADAEEAGSPRPDGAAAGHRRDR
jgi:DnaJ-class molecular chaperone